MRATRRAEDKRESSDQPTYVVKYFLNKHRESLINSENDKRRQLKESMDVTSIDKSNGNNIC